MFLTPRKCFQLLIGGLFFAALLLTGCSGGGGGGTTSVSGPTSGIAVDPYIEGAVFQEVAPGGAVLQESSPSDENGRFTFQNQLTVGSTIRIKTTARGRHNDLPFTGTLKREVDTSGTQVVSPLTTLLANGLTEAETLSLLHEAGLSGLNRQDLYADPMAGLDSLLSLGDDDLKSLQAAIAVNQFMLLQGDYEMSRAEMEQHREMLAHMVKLVQQVLNRHALEEALEEISGPMANARVTPTMGASIRAGVNIIDTAVARHMADSSKDPLNEAGNLQGWLDDLALMYAVREHRGEAYVEDEIERGNLPEIDDNSHPDIDDLEDEKENDNSPIIADAGEDQEVAVGSTVYLSGSFSMNSSPANMSKFSHDDWRGRDDDDDDDDDDWRRREDDDELTFFWAFEAKPAGSSAQLSNNRSPNPSFVADREGTYVLTLTVYDDDASIPDTVSIYASSGTENLPPVADSGSDRLVTTGETVTLDGSGSFDNDGDLLTYTWAFASMPPGSSASLSDPFSENPNFIADRDGTYIVSLTVNDGLVDSIPDSLTVTAASGNVPPVADAGPNQNVPVGTTVSLNGSSSSDADNDLLAYSWTLTTKPSGSSAALNSSSAVNPSFIADLPGNYQVKLLVNDGTVDSAPDFVSITAASGNVPPVADAGPNQNVGQGSTVNLDGSGSSDGDNDLLTYAWTMTGKPTGSSAALSSSSSVNPSFVADLAGSYTIRLIVNDGTVNSAADFVTVNAASSNVPPTANGGPNQNVFVFDLVSLDGTGSSDPDGDPLSYSWSITAKPSGSSATLSAANVANPTFVADFAGTYTIRLVVNDGTVNSAADTVTVTASSSNVAPTANAGADQNVTAGDSVNLNGNGSSDPDGDPLTYSWSFTSRPSGSTAALSNSTAAAPSFTADVAGSYVIRLVVNDGAVNSSPDSVTVTAASPPASCTSCHGQPPTVGAHILHTGLASVNNDCATCHSNNNHMNGVKDVNIISTYKAKSGSLAWSGTSCSAVSCHGGQTTPAWIGGSINVNTQCTSCHESGTSQYNSYNSGKHTFHLGFLTCTSCHNTSTLAQNHFSNLDTTTMEGPASATIGGGSTVVSSYSNRGCTVSCHGTDKKW